jgi:hypothetical protein
LRKEEPYPALAIYIISQYFARSGLKNIAVMAEGYFSAIP